MPKLALSAMIVNRANFTEIMSIQLSPQQLFWMHLLSPVPHSQKRLRESLIEGADAWASLGLMKEKSVQSMTPSEALRLAAKSLGSEKVIERLAVLSEFMSSAKTTHEFKVVSDTLLYLIEHQAPSKVLNSWLAKKGDMNVYFFAHKLLRDQISLEKESLPQAIEWVHKYVLPSHLWSDDVHQNISKYLNAEVQSAYWATYQEEAIEPPKFKPTLFK